MIVALLSAGVGAHNLLPLRLGHFRPSDPEPLRNFHQMLRPFIGITHIQRRTAHNEFTRGNQINSNLMSSFKSESTAVTDGSA